MWSLTPCELYLPSVARYPVFVCMQHVEHVCVGECAQWDPAATTMIASFHQRHMWHCVLYCGHKRVLSQHCGCWHVSIQTQFFKIRQGRKADLGIPTHSPLFPRLTQINYIKKKRDLKSKEDFRLSDCYRIFFFTDWEYNMRPCHERQRKQITLF